MGGCVAKGVPSRTASTEVLKALMCNYYRRAWEASVAGGQWIGESGWNATWGCGVPALPCPHKAMGEDFAAICGFPSTSTQ